jgi:hypothetical protein
MKALKSEYQSILPKEAAVGEKNSHQDNRERPALLYKSREQADFLEERSKSNVLT